MKRVLITGATGFVGANLASRLILDGHKVTLFVRAESDHWRIERIKEIRPDCDIHTVRLDDLNSVQTAVDAVKPEWIFHLAVHGAYSWQTEWQRMVETNVVGTMNLVEACLKNGFESFINTGSSSEYGFKNHAPREDEFIEPNSYYAVTKASATQYCRFVAIDRKVNLSTLRLYSVYGSYEEPNRLMPTMAVRGLNKELPPLVDPNVARDYVFIDDVVDAYLLAATTKDIDLGSVFNVGSGVQTTIREVVDTARKVLDITTEPQWGSMANRVWDTSVWVANNKKIVETLKWQPKHSFEAGFTKLVEWLKANQQNGLLERYIKQIPGAKSLSPTK